MTRFSFLICLTMPLSALAAFAQGTVSTSAGREAVVDSAAKIAAGSESTSAAVIAIDPFNPPAANLRWDASPENGSKTSGLSDAQMVGLLIQEIKPTGSIQLGGEPYLLFTERRQKNGDKLIVTLDKVEYVIEIVSIASNRFRIRYNGQEAERPIK